MKSVFDVRASKRYDTSMDRNGKRMIQNDQVQEDPRKTKTPFSCGKSFSRPAAYRIHRVLTSPWFSPLRGSHRAARRQKDHYSVMALSYEEAGIHLPSTYRSFPQWEIIAFVTDVAHHHRNVTEECVFNFQGADARCCLACL